MVFCVRDHTHRLVGNALRCVAWGVIPQIYHSSVVAPGVRGYGGRNLLVRARSPERDDPSCSQDPHQMVGSADEVYPKGKISVYIYIYTGVQVEVHKVRFL